MKSLMLFLRTALNDMGAWCCISTTLDYKTIERRVESEGLSFITITLPSFGKDLEKALDIGMVDSTHFTGFSRKGALPRFLGGFASLIFDDSTGVLLDTPSIDAIRCLRQLTLMFAKINVECSKERNDAALRRYVECELEVRTSDAQPGYPAMLDDLSRIGGMLYGEMFTEIDGNIYARDVIVPKHGPGSTADKLLGNKKYNQVEWTERLESIFPFGEFVCPSWIAYLDVEPQLTIHEPGAERPVKIITVPKTLKTPRIIAKEPTCMQYMQQGILELIDERVQRDHSLRALIGWRSQVPNQKLALHGSLTGSLATLDLSEASDRVSNQHVRALLRRFPSLLEAVDATRSRKADVLGHGIITLAKFASMGSALCFPFEAMVFLAIIFLTVEQEQGHPLTKADIKSYLGKVRVYGDDIIVPVDLALPVQRKLEAFGLKVNASKSFWTGKFRESCGKEYYDGHDVSITRVRSMFPTVLGDAEQLVSTVSLRNQLFLRGFTGAVDYLDKLLERLIPFPIVSSTSAILGKLSYDPIRTESWDPELQLPLVRGAIEKAILPANPLDGWGALMKHLLKRGDLPFADSRHLQYSGRSVSVNIKIRRMSPH